MRLFCVAFVVLLVSVVGCGSKDSGGGAGHPPSYPGSKSGPPGGRLNEDTLKQIQIGETTFNDLKRILNSEGERTNEEKPGLAPGSSKFVWKEGNKKLYASFGAGDKVNGLAWEGFGGK